MAVPAAPATEPALLTVAVAPWARIAVPDVLEIVPPLATFTVAPAPSVTAVNPVVTLESVAVEPAVTERPPVAVIAPDRVATPSTVTVPVPLTALTKAWLSLRAKVRLALLARTAAPRKDPADPPAPILRLPPSTLVPPE